jgi:hypothetical protein
MILLRLQYRDLSRASVAIFFALLLSYALAPALHAQLSGTTIVFYAQPQVSDELWPDLFQSLRADLAAGMGESPKGFALDQNPTYLRGDKDLAVGLVFSELIQVKLLGRCDLLTQPDRPFLRGPLGWVLQVSGAIQPFVFVDCTRIAQVLRSGFIGLDMQGRRHEMAQAIAHVVIHEWIHVATQSSSHGREGITRQFLSVGELTKEPPKNDLAIATH